MGIFLKVARSTLIGLMANGRFHNGGTKKHQEKLWSRGLEPKLTNGTKVWKGSQELSLLKLNSKIFSEFSNALIYGKSFAMIKAFNILWHAHILLATLAHWMNQVNISKFVMQVHVELILYFQFDTLNWNYLFINFSAETRMCVKPWLPNKFDLYQARM